MNTAKIKRIKIKNSNKTEETRKLQTWKIVITEM